MADMHRTMQSRKLLTQLSDEAKRAKEKLVTQRERYHSVQTEITAMEHRLQQLKHELQAKERLAESTHRELEDLNVKIKYDEEKLMGLCIR
jgi:predicted  nucleic acid-binding Zn-ribbon protein